MSGKNSLLSTLLIVAGAFVVVTPAEAGRQCGELLEKVCIGCHESDRFCGRLGAPEKEVQALVKRMVSNGADLEKDEIGTLAACLSSARDEAKIICAK